MRTSTVLQTAGRTMAATHVAMMNCDPWRWNLPPTYTIRAAMNFFADQNPGRFKSRKFRHTSDMIDKGLRVYNLPDGSRLCVISKTKVCWEINSEGEKL